MFELKKMVLKIVLLFGFFLFVSPVYAQGTVNLGSMFANFVGSLHQLLDLLQYASYVIGIFLVVGSVYKFSQLGQGNNQLTVKTPLVMFFVGVAIFALTGSVAVMTQTMAMGSGPGDLLAPSMPGMDAMMGQAMLGVFLFIRLVGYIAFIRGFLLLNQYGQGKNEALGKGLVHIFGGIAAINVTVTAQILANTFAPGMPMPF